MSSAAVEKPPLEKALVTVDLDSEAVDAALNALAGLSVAKEDIESLRLDSIGAAVAARSFARVVWVDLLS